MYATIGDMEEGGVVEKNNPEQSLFHAEFSDGTVFVLPKGWEPVFIDYFGTNPKNYRIVGERLTIIAQKYKDHNAFPDKFDGFDMKNDELETMNVYDNPQYYFQEDRGNWEDRWESEHKKHTMAEIANQFFYLAMRPGIMQQAVESKKNSFSGINQLIQGIESGDAPTYRMQLLIGASHHFLRHLTPYINWQKE